MHIPPPRPPADPAKKFDIYLRDRNTEEVRCGKQNFQTTDVRAARRIRTENDRSVERNQYKGLRLQHITRRISLYYTPCINVCPTMRIKNIQLKKNSPSRLRLRPCHIQRVRGIATVIGTCVLRVFGTLHWVRDGCTCDHHHAIHHHAHGHIVSNDPPKRFGRLTPPCHIVRSARHVHHKNQ